MSKRLGWIAAGLGLIAAGLQAAPARPIKPKDACTLVRPATGDLIRVPFREIDGRIYVDALVNGRGPYVFALDTGASGMGRIDAALKQALNLPVVDQGETSDGVASASVDLVAVDAIRLGGLERRSMQLITRDYRSRQSARGAFAGILGREFFGDGLLVIDYARGQIRFTRRQQLTPNLAGAMAYDRAFRVPVRIGETTVTGNLDTGANVTFLFPAALYQQVSSLPLGEPVAGSLTNSSLSTQRGVVPGPIRIGAITMRDAPVLVSDKFPELLVGSLFLRRHAVLIDQRHRAVALCPQS